MPNLSVPSAPNESSYESIAELLHHHSEVRADKPFIVALDQDGRAISYDQMWKLSNRLSRFLAARAVGPGERIAVLTDNRLEMAVLYFAILRYGAAFCTINIEVNAANMQEMLRRINPVLILHHEGVNIESLNSICDCDRISFGDCSPAGKNASDRGLFEILNDYDDGNDAPTPELDQRIFAF